MASIKLKFRASLITDKEGVLYYQVIHRRTVRQITTNYKIFAWEWNSKDENFIDFDLHYSRFKNVSFIKDNVKHEMERLKSIIHTLDNTDKPYSSDDVVSSFIGSMSKEISLFDYTQKYISKLCLLNRYATSDHVTATLNNFKKFRNNSDIKLSMLDAEIIEMYEAFLKDRGNTRNTTSYYIRTLRSIYNQAIDDGILSESQENIFRRVYTGIDKTVKRAISIKDIKRIQTLDLYDAPNLCFARDLFMFCFYTRGMSFIDIAYLKKKDLANGELTYRRHKTGQTLNITWEKVMQIIVEQYPSETQYLLPIITSENGTERKQYKNAMMLINRKLKKIGRLAGVTQEVSIYTARHSWASAARDKNIPLSVISEALGHDSDKNTQIYLSTLKTTEVSKANKRIIQEIMR